MFLTHVREEKSQPNQIWLSAIVVIIIVVIYNEILSELSWRDL